MNKFVLCSVLGLTMLSANKDRQHYYSDDLFAREEPIEITLRGDLSALMKDRGQDPQYHNLTFSFRDGEKSASISIRSKVRGHFRKDESNCSYPPLLLNFGMASALGDTPFAGQEKMKLVMPCRGDRYVAREYLVYRIYNLLTPKSLKARLARVTLEDSVKGKTTESFYGILLEEESQMAARNGNVPVEGRIVRPENTVREDFLRMAVFEYLIGNTDWSVQYMQNVKLMAPRPDAQAIPVPYDFDHAGIVAAPYAKPSEMLELASTRIRRYRGFCIEDMTVYQPAFDQFNAIKTQLYGLYTESKLIDASYIKSTTKFMDEFYKTINDPKLARREFLYPCDGSTANVVIKPLDK